MRAQLTLLEQPRKASDAAVMAAGLEAAGLTVHRNIGGAPKPDDVLVVWNRMGAHETLARRWEQAKARVIVLENGYLGADWQGRRWFAMSMGHHNGWGRWPDGGPERWDSWGVELAPMREGGAGLVLAQRGIAEQAQRPPAGYFALLSKLHNARIRRHPGTDKTATPLEADLSGVGTVYTWASGAAIKASLLGCRVVAGMPRWIAAGLTGDNPDRLGVLRRMAWAMWNRDEVASGEAFRRVLAC